MAVAATTMMIVPVLIVIVMAAESLLLLVTAIAKRQQEGIEDLHCDLSPFLAGRCVGEAEMNPHKDATVDDVGGQIREAKVPPRLWIGQSGISGDVERHFVGVEKARGDCREGARQVVGARSVVRIRRRPNQRGPARIGLRLQVSVIVPRSTLLNRRDRSPEVVVLLTVPGSD